MKTGMLKETLSGDMVEVGYDTFRHTFWINGRPCERVQSLEHKKGVWVFEFWLEEADAYKRFHFSLLELQAMARS